MKTHNIMFENRVARVQEKLKDRNLEAILITNPSNIFYLTGIFGIEGDREFLVVISRDDIKVITSELHGSTAKKKFSDFLLIPKEGLLKGAINEMRKYNRIGFEKENLKYYEYEIFRKNLGKRIHPVSNFVEDLRKIKDRKEIKLIKKAVEITDKTFYTILEIIKPGLTEKYIQRKIIEVMESLGGEGPSFEPIVAGGKGSAEPHHITSNKRIKEEEILLIDIGVRYKGYCSDFTRTIFVGSAPEKFKRLYQIVLETQEKSIKNCKEGLEIRRVYEEAVLNFRKYGEDKYFIHGLGHGIGIDIHESPNIGAREEEKFERGMVFTIEPGIYHKNFGGIRIEDTCIMGKKCRPLSKATRELIEI